MILTGKAKTDFLKWNEDNDAPLSTYAIEQGLIYGTVLNSIIIEWFDSVGIYIDSLHSYSFDNSLEYCVKVNNTYISHGIKNKPMNRFDSRKEATEQAIKKANDIYNEAFK